VKRLQSILGIVVVVVIVLGLYFARGMFASKDAATTGGGSAVATATATPITVKGLWGSDKDVLLADKDIKAILASKYGITVTGKVQSQFNLKQTDVEDKDFVWHSSRVSVDEYKSKGYPDKREAVIVRSPLVVYAWSPVTVALQKNKVVSKAGVTYYVTDLPRLTTLMTTDKPWSTLGLDLYGPVNIYSTDPKLTNSGMLYYALVGTVMSGSSSLSSANIEKVMPKLQAFYAAQGAMDSKNQWLLEGFLQKGMGETPMIATWESELQEFVLQHPGDAAFVKKSIQVLYPKPTIWSDHIFIAETDKGIRLLEALKDPEIQKLAWERHGFRTGLSGTQTDPKALQTLGIPATIDSAIPTPRPEVMKRIKDGL
jgi:hypothetical protein